MVKKINEITLYVLTLIWFLLVTLTVSPSLGQVYIAFTFGGILLYILDKKKSIVLDKDGKLLNAAVAAGAFTIIFLIFSTATISFLQEINIGGLIGLLAASTPVLAESKILNFITFGFPVAFVETAFFIRLFDFFASRLKIPLNRESILNPKALALIGVLSLGFLLYHLEAKGIENNSGLLLVFIMMFISLIMALYYGEGKQAVLFHIFLNTLAASTMVGIFSIQIQTILPIITSLTSII